MAAGWVKNSQLSGFTIRAISSSVMYSGGGTSPDMMAHQWSSAGLLVSMMRPSRVQPPSRADG